MDRDLEAAIANAHNITPLTEILDKILERLIVIREDVASSLQPGLTRAQIDEHLQYLSCKIPEVLTVNNT